MMQKQAPMDNSSEAVSQYIYRSAPFAIPILEHIRNIVHDSCPDAQETIKWNFPNFTYKGKILCHMAAFKKHCSFGFWLASHMKDPLNILESAEKKEAMGNLGRITSLSELPSRSILKKYIKEAAELIDNGVTLSKTKTDNSPAVEIPADLQLELNRNRKAAKEFSKLSSSHKREYALWITEAKKEETRLKRIISTIQMVAEGKTKNHKYQSKLK